MRSRDISEDRTVIFIKVFSDSRSNQSTNISSQRLNAWKFLIEIGIRVRIWIIFVQVFVFHFIGDLEPILNQRKHHFFVEFNTIRVKVPPLEEGQIVQVIAAVEVDGEHLVLDLPGNEDYAIDNFLHVSVIEFCCQFVYLPQDSFPISNQNSHSCKCCHVLSSHSRLDWGQLAPIFLEFALGYFVAQGYQNETSDQFVAMLPQVVYSQKWSQRKSGCHHPRIFPLQPPESPYAAKPLGGKLEHDKQSLPPDIRYMQCTLIIPQIHADNLVLEELSQNHLRFGLSPLLSKILVDYYGPSHFEVVPFLLFQHHLLINQLLLLVFLFLQFIHIEFVRFVSCASFEIHLFSLIKNNVFG